MRKYRGKLLILLLLISAGLAVFLLRPNPGEEDRSQKSEDKGIVCIQVITRARNPMTGEEKDFPTPCDVPKGWEKINEIDEAHDANQ